MAKNKCIYREVNKDSKMLKKKKTGEAVWRVYMCSFSYFFLICFRFQSLTPSKKTLLEQEYFKVIFTMQTIPPNPIFADLDPSTIPSFPVPDLVDFSLLYTFIAQ